MKPEYFEWVDSHSPEGSEGWIGMDDIEHHTLHIDTVGYVIKECDENVTVASQIAKCQDGCVSGVITIPKTAIKKRRKLK